ncbi:unnamed protein product [Staurois parvus]|uniref:Uncharacterized protein n=1 Tax=Staurois parvus TaxID=386267 RepID=A0ABN9H6L9_9NEOB|nr:unnamed protein product [Staurois parvus]
MIGAQQCHLPVPPTCAQQCHPPVPRGATHLCPSVQPSSAANQCHPAVPPVISAAYQCRLSVLSASSSVLPISATYQCPSVLPISAHQCHLISAASSTHISEGEKLAVCKIL